MIYVDAFPRLRSTEKSLKIFVPRIRKGTVKEWRLVKCPCVSRVPLPVRSAFNTRRCLTD
jgi:hypothetical protein